MDCVFCNKVYEKKMSIGEIDLSRLIKEKRKKKEVIQPQVPLRLPCDDLTLLTELRFDLVKETEPHLNPARVV